MAHSAASSRASRIAEIDHEVVTHAGGDVAAERGHDFRHREALPLNDRAPILRIGRRAAVRRAQQAARHDSEVSPLVVKTARPVADWSGGRRAVRRIIQRRDRGFIGGGRRLSQPIAHAGDGLDREAAMRFGEPTDRLDTPVDRILADRATAPAGQDEVIAGNHMATPSGQGDENLHDPGLQHHCSSACEQFPGWRRHLHPGQREHRYADQIYERLRRLRSRQLCTRHFLDAPGRLPEVLSMGMGERQAKGRLAVASFGSGG